MKRILLLIFPLFAMLGISGYAMRVQRGTSCDALHGVASVGAAKYSVDLATTPRAWEQGLSGRPPLRKDEGMLFVFPDSSIRRFWMKDMNFPIDIVWIDNAGKVIGLVPAADPTSYPKTFASPGPVNRVLELSADSGVHEGDVVTVGCR